MLHPDLFAVCSQEYSSWWWLHYLFLVCISVPKNSKALRDRRRSYYVWQFCYHISANVWEEIWQWISHTKHAYACPSETLCDGSVYSFWLFSFERCNGVFGSIPNNRKNIEVQFMDHYCQFSQLLSLLTDIPKFYHSVPYFTTLQEFRLGSLSNVNDKLRLFKSALCEMSELKHWGVTLML